VRREQLPNGNMMQATRALAVEGGVFELQVHAEDAAFEL
jgi:hypothetical protein